MNKNKYAYSLPSKIEFKTSISIYKHFFSNFLSSNYEKLHVALFFLRFDYIGYPIIIGTVLFFKFFDKNKQLDQI